MPQTGIRKIFNWIRYSGVWITFILNPFHWTFRFENIVNDELSPMEWRIDIQFFFINIRIVLDDGSW